MAPPLLYKVWYLEARKATFDYVSSPAYAIGRGEAGRKASQSIDHMAIVRLWDSMVVSLNVVLYGLHVPAGSRVIK